MADDSSAADELLERLRQLKRWRRGDAHAPHKPLLLLLTLGRIASGGARLASFAELEPALTQLLSDFGPARKQHKPSEPFWRLQGDGLWEVTSSERVRCGSSGSPRLNDLRDPRVRGGFTELVDDRLRASPQLLALAAETLLQSCFPSTLHEDIRAAVGLELPGANFQEDRRRSADFRQRVLIAYEFQCAVCGLNSRVNTQLVGLEAAHVKWFQYGGPCELNNGLCLCSLHHKAFDSGALSLSPDARVVISDLLHGGEQVHATFLRFSGRPLRGPQAGYPGISSGYITWHRANIFKGQARPPAA